jgi:hypothetical protein
MAQKTLEMNDKLLTGQIAKFLTGLTFWAVGVILLGGKTDSIRQWCGG